MADKYLNDKELYKEKADEKEKTCERRMCMSIYVSLYHCGNDSRNFFCDAISLCAG